MVDDNLHDELILIRTPVGQGLTFDKSQLDEAGRRLLCLVNGYTSLGYLAACLDPGHDWHAIAGRLLRQGLVAVEVG